MTGNRMEDADDWFRDVLKYAAVAGGCRALARREPDAARGLNKVAHNYSEQARTLLTASLRAAPADRALVRPFPQEPRHRRTEGRGV